MMTPISEILNLIVAGGENRGDIGILFLLYDVMLRRLTD